MKTHRPRADFVKDIPQIMAVLNPHRTAGHQTAATFEGFFFGAEDAKGPFTFSWGVSRNVTGGSEWAANRCLYPYPTLGPVGPNEKLCP